MENYIAGNKEAWEEAFEMRSEDWGRDVADKVSHEEYPFFYQETIERLKNYDLAGKTIGQFCCNNGRELMSLVHSANAKQGFGFDIAENMVEFANNTAKQIQVPCEFIATNVYEIGEEFTDRFDFVLITEGALCWLKDLTAFFKVVARCLKKNGSVLICEQHPMTTMLAFEGEELYDEKHPTNCVYSYFHHEWVGNDGMYYITGKSYKSKTFTDYTHALSEIISGMCANSILITNLIELEYDIVGGSEPLNNQGFPLSMIMEGRLV